MKNLKKYMGLLLALVMCLSLVACGGAPDKLKVIVIDDSVVYDYSAFSGTWSGENDSILVMKEEEDGRKHFILSDADDEWIASGLFQYAEEYGCVYAHNDYDGIAYRCWFDEDNTLHISSLGTFSKVNGDVPGENVSGTDYGFLAGKWHIREGYSDSDYTIEFWDDGSWSFLEWDETVDMDIALDWGTLEVDEDYVKQYRAVSNVADRYYEVTIVDEETLCWNAPGESACFYVKIS